jgi:hypothetical protein
MAFQVTAEWSSRSRALQSRLQQKVPGVSFWLSPATPPAQFGFVAPQDVGAWHTAKTIPLFVSTDLANQTATVTVPTGMTHVRLDFDLVGTAGGQSATILTLKQLFLAASVGRPGPQERGALLPAQFTVEDAELVATADGPVRKNGPSPTGYRTQLGLHPLLSLAAPGKFSVNTEFVDVTELWWRVHPDRTWGWCWHPDLKARQGHLRVLAWTGGGNPMIWFAVIPDAAVTSSPEQAESPVKGTPQTATTPADIVFFRPPPGSNSFPYSPTQGGFEAKEHNDITLVNLARYLLSPVPEKTFLALKAAGVRTPELLADQVQPKSTTGTVKPADPMGLMKLVDASDHVRKEAFTDTRANAFRPVGLEAALNRSGGAHVLFLPLGFSASKGEPEKGIQGNPQGGYEAVQMPNLKATVQNALTVLWSVNAVGRDKPSPPRTAERELWVAGHSEGNRRVWDCLKANGKDIDRVISFDSDTLDRGIAEMKAAGKKHTPEKPLHAFVIITPATTGDATGLPVKRDKELRALRKSGVLVTALPDFAAGSLYWHLNPPPITNPYLLYLLAKWNVPARPGGGGTSRTLLDISATTPGNWGFLFFHELAVFGGELIQPAVGLGGSSPAPPYLRTFFEMALGAPNPRPP